MATIYRKTEKGQLEIETRATRLVPRLRTGLILVDGRRSDADLNILIANEPAAVLQSLLDGGYIEVAGMVAGPTSAPLGVAAPRVVAPAPTATADSVPERRRAAVRYLTDLLGPVAETSAMRIEKCRNGDELQAALIGAHRVLQSVRGAAVAEKFALRFIESPSA